MVVDNIFGYRLTFTKTKIHVAKQGKKILTIQCPNKLTKIVLSPKNKTLSIWTEGKKTPENYIIG